MRIFNLKTFSILLAVAMLLCVAMPIYAVGGGAGDVTPESQGYEVLISKYGDSTIRVGGELYLMVTASKFFNATEIMIKYDTEKLDYSSIYMGEENFSVTETSNGVKLIDYGNHAATPVYVLKFDVSENIEATPESPSSVTFEVVEAGFGTIESAADQNLIPATLPEEPLEIEIRPMLISVSYNSGEFYTATDSIEKGADLVFYPEKSTGKYYEYDLPVVSVNGQSVTVISSGDGGWKVEDVSGTVTIAPASRTPINYGEIVYNDVDGAPVITDKTKDAVYNSDVVFTVPADKAPTETVGGYDYNVTATIGGQSYSLRTPVENTTGMLTYTIPGTDVKGAVVITLVKTNLEPTKYTVSIEGDGKTDGEFEGAVGGAGASVQVDKDGTASVTLNVATEEGLNAGYHYEVKVNGTTVELSTDNQVKIENIQSNITVTIEKSLNVDGVTNVNAENKNFLAMEEQNMWLIQMPNHVKNTESANYTYKGQEMFWSADHNTFVCVVISKDEPSIEASDFGLVSVSQTQSIASQNWDVNKSGDLDANDAQLIWNMYNDQYSGFSESITAEKFILADANHDGVLDTKDASVIINQIRASLTTE